MTSSQSLNPRRSTNGNGWSVIPWWGSLIAGGALAAVGLSRRSKAGLALAAAGGALAYSGIKSGHSEQATLASTSLVVNCTSEEAYRLWRDFTNLPRFMNHLESVTSLDGNRSKWAAVTPLGIKLQWNAEIDADREGELISWHSLPGSDIGLSGRVEFRPAPANRGTLLVVVLEYSPAARGTSRSLASMLGKRPSFFLRQDLRRFKALVETGEIPTTEGQSHGKRSRVIGVARALNPTDPMHGEAQFAEVIEARRRAS